VTRRVADTRQRDLERAERLAVKLHVEAMAQGERCKAENNQADWLSWWRVRQAAAEAVDELRRARRAPGLGFVKAVHPAAPLNKDAERDHQGVPAKSE
jgi:hypothetical protein